MGWSHCEVADIADTVACPACGVTKAAWTLKVDATRTFTIARKTKRREKTAWVEVELPGAAGAQVEVETPDGQLLARILDAAGLARLDGLYAEPVRVRFPGRDERCAGAAPDAEGWTTCAPERRHTFGVEVARKPGAGPAEAVLLQPEEGTHTQWVNLSSDPADFARGSLLRVRIGLPGGAPGQKVWLRATRGEGHSLRNDPPPATVGGKSIVEAPLELTLPASGEVEVEVELGLAGGDVLHLAVGATPDCAGPKVTITNRRKVWFQVTRPDVAPEVDFAPMVEAYRLVDIDLVRMPDLVLTPDRPDTKPGTWVSGKELGDKYAPGQRLVIGNHNEPWFLQRRAPAPGPAFHFVYVHGIYNPWNTAWTREPHTTGPFSFTLPTPDDALPRIPFNGSYDLFSIALHDGGDSLVRGSWKSLAPEGHDDHGKSGDLHQKDIAITLRSGLAVTTGSVTPGPGGPGAEHHPVEVELELYVAYGPALGRALQSGQSAIAITPGDDPWRTAVFTHELGHALGQAGSPIPPGLEALPHGRLYVEHDHHGAHCATGLSDADFARPHYQDRPGAVCIMWGQTNSTPPVEGGRFCDRCVPFVRAASCQF
jgi:hypothetical protein